MPPELLRHSGVAYRANVDMWAYACTLCELRTGQTPFAAPTARELFANILHKRVAAGDDAFSRLVRGCLDRDVATRLGADEAKAQPFFHAVDWARALAMQLEPPSVPELPSFIRLDAHGHCTYYAHDGECRLSSESSESSSSSTFRFFEDDDDVENEDPKRLSGRHTPRIKLFRGFALDADFNLQDARPADYDPLRKSWASSYL